MTTFCRLLTGGFLWVVLGVAVSAPLTNDPLAGKQDYLNRLGVARIWPLTTGQGVTVAVIDSGVAPVADLAGQLVPGWNVVEHNSNTADADGHGTWVAGTIAARCNNHLGSAGVACGVKIMPVRVVHPVVHDGATHYEAFNTDIGAGIRWAVDHGAQVVNVSYDQLMNDYYVDTAATYAEAHGVIVVVAAGNCGCYDRKGLPDPHVIVVSALDAHDRLASYSSYGRDVDIAAPGSVITPDTDGRFLAVDGTSFATPIVAATLALMRAANPHLTVAQLRQVLLTTTDAAGGTDWTEELGFGRVNTARAVLSAAAQQ